MTPAPSTPPAIPQTAAALHRGPWSQAPGLRHGCSSGASGVVGRPPNHMDRMCLGGLLTCLHACMIGDHLSCNKLPASPLKYCCCTTNVLTQLHASKAITRALQQQPTPNTTTGVPQGNTRTHVLAYEHSHLPHVVHLLLAMNLPCSSAQQAGTAFSGWQNTCKARG